MGMETITAKITYVHENQRQYSGKVPMFIHKIRFENDKEKKVWDFHSPSEVCDKFKEGEVATFTTEIKQRGQYTDYNIRPAGQGTGKSFGGGMQKKDEGVITYLSCFSSACNFYANKLQASEEDLFALAEKAFKQAISKSTNK